MDEEYEDSGGTRWRVVILILCALLAAAAIVLAYFLFWRKPPADENVNRIGYAEEAVAGAGVTAVDESALQSAAYNLVLLEESSPGVSLEYKNNPKSDDGKNFTCHIANAADNQYDMYIAVYADSGCTDELFRSGRLPPGTPLAQLTLARALEPGVHECTVAFIQVEDGSETVHAQTLITMDFTVS